MFRKVLIKSAFLLFLIFLLAAYCQTPQAWAGRGQNNRGRDFNGDTVRQGQDEDSETQGFSSGQLPGSQREQDREYEQEEMESNDWQGSLKHRWEEWRKGWQTEKTDKQQQNYLRQHQGQYKGEAQEGFIEQNRRGKDYEQEDGAEGHRQLNRSYRSQRQWTGDGHDNRWRSLDPESRARVQQRLRQYDQLEPRSQERLQQRWKRFHNLPSEEQEKLRSRFQKWQNLSPEQRELLRERRQQWQKLTPQEQQQILQKSRKWFSMSEEQRQQIREQQQRQRNSP